MAAASQKRGSGQNVFDVLLMIFQRSRTLYAVLTGLTIVVGLASRHFTFLLPPLLAKNAGDVLYAVMAYWLLGLCLPRLFPTRTAFAAGLFCFGIEFLKLSQMPWLVAARAGQAGALVFGRGFHVSNLVCYTLGVALALGLEISIRHFVSGEAEQE